MSVEIRKYGLKRTIGRHFIFEIAAGFGAYVVQNYDWEGVIAIDGRKIKILDKVKLDRISKLG